MSDNVTIFDQYAIRHNPEPAPEQDNRADYTAIGLDKTKDRQTRLRIHYGDRTIDLFSYAHLLEVCCTDQEHLLLCFSNCILSVEGRHLEELIEPLQDERVRYLLCFNAKYFAPPPDDAVLIERLVRQNLHELRRP